MKQQKFHPVSNPAVHITNEGDKEASNAKNFFSQRNKQKLNVSYFPDNSLNKVRRTQEYNRIMNDNEAMLKRLQSRQSNYNVMDWENDRKNQIRLIKQICHYKPSISKRKKAFKRKYEKLDMEKRYASAGPNKQMYEMYNMSLRQSGMPTALSIMERQFDTNASLDQSKMEYTD